MIQDLEVFNEKINLEHFPKCLGKHIPRRIFCTLLLKTTLYGSCKDNLEAPASGVL